MQVYTISQHCKFVKGAKRAAIYDLKNEKVYSINETGKRIIEGCINKEVDTLSEIEESYLRKLSEIKLIELKEIEHIDDVIVYDEIFNPKLNFMWLELTEKCNLKCIHCYGDCGKANEISNNHMKNEKKEMNLDDWKIIISQGAEIGCNKLQFIGGEPTIFKTELVELVKYARKKNYKEISVFTNATLIDPMLIDCFIINQVQVHFSLYGHNAKIHDSITGKEGSFDRTINNIKLLKKNNIHVAVAVIIMKNNQDYVEEIKNFINELNLNYRGYDVIRPVYKGEQNKYVPDKKEVIDKKYIKKPFFRTSKEKYNVNKSWNNCWYGKIAITSTGDIIPCIFERNIIIDNVKDVKLKDLLKSPKLKKYWSITKDHIDVCKDCEYRYACNDCRPLALGVEGDMYAKYPRCKYDPYNGIWIDDESL